MAILSMTKPCQIPSLKIGFALVVYVLTLQFSIGSCKKRDGKIFCNKIVGFHAYEAGFVS